MTIAEGMKEYTKLRKAGYANVYSHSAKLAHQDKVACYQLADWCEENGYPVLAATWRRIGKWTFSQEI